MIVSLLTTSSSFEANKVSAVALQFFTVFTNFGIISFPERF